MKRGLLIVVGCWLLVVGARAQINNYIPIPDSVAVWREDHWYGGTCEDYHSSSFIIFEDGKLDTLGYSYIVLKKTGYDGICYIHPFSHSQTFAAISSYSNTPSGYFRNDTTRKVFYREDFNTAEELLYDFNLQVGDTVYQFPFNPMYFTRVQNIDTVFLGGVNRRRFHVVDIYNYPTGDIIEGIGASQGFLIGRRMQPYFENGDALVCMSVNDTAVYPDSTAHCALLTGISTIRNPQSAIRISPNPATTHLTIQLQQTPSSSTAFQLFDITGRMILQKLLSDKTNNIDVSGVSKGMYLYNVVIGGEKAGAGKVVIE